MKPFSKHTKDLTGLVFGHLTVKEYAGQDKKKRALWAVVCVCGKECVKQSYHLVRGATTSCGCERNAAKRGGSETTKNISYKTHQKRAREKGIAYLTREAWSEIVVRPCHYCRGYDMRGYRTATSMSDSVFETMIIPLNGVDRVDNARGYEPENCVPCCYACNRAKGSMSYGEFVEHVRKMYACTQDHLSRETRRTEGVA